MTDLHETERLPSVPPNNSNQTWPQTASRTNPNQVHTGFSAPDSPYSPSFAEASKRRNRSRFWKWMRTLVVFIVLAIPLGLVLTLGAVYWQARADEARPVDAIVVLGAAQYNGRPSAVFRARLDHAFTLYADGYAPKIVLTGGKMVGDAYTEAEAGQMYLADLGVPEDAMILANSGSDTWSSFEEIDRTLAGTDIHSLLLVSDGFHLLRSEMMARHFGFEAYGSAATDSPIREGSGSEFSYAVRETGGIVAILPKILF